MIGRRALWELFHTLLGIGAAVVIAWGSAWAYPLATTDIWVVATVAMVLVAVLGIAPFRRAMAEDAAVNAKE